MMSDPLEWNSLDEAAAWLAEATGEQWTARRVLDAAIRYPTADGGGGAPNRHTIISAALPPGHSIRVRVVNLGAGREIVESRGHAVPEAARNDSTVPLYDLSWRTVPLLQSDVFQVLASGWVELKALHERASMPRIDEALYINAIEPPARVGLDALGVKREHLRTLAARTIASDGKVASVRATDESSEHAPAVPPSDDWHEAAREQAAHIVTRDRARNLFPSQELIADEIARDWRNRGITGKDGKALSAATIKRHALKGVTIGAPPRRATQGKRGK